ncbi:SAM-dependent chlorinase/fluorinase [Candidatus Bipolaricaulota bacterium]|nr:SAM-dependent chlorinase/fluorinase [Candidatus Bipolaricaulota bacterium]
MKRRAVAVVVLVVLLFGLTAFAASHAEPNGVIAFVTDFGRKDFYVGAMEGVVLSKFPEAKIVHISHEVEEYNIREGAITTYLAAKEYPKGTVFCTVVDPGVGTERKPIVLETETGHYFIGPDNGVLTMVMNNMGVKEVRVLENPDWRREGWVSKTFHGRDVFSPGAAHLASGEPFTEAGPEYMEYKTLDIQQSRIEDGAVVGEAVMIDEYGNIQANVHASELEEIGLEVGDTVEVQIGEVVEQAEYATTYGDVPEGDFLVFRASTDFIEVAINMGSAQENFGAELGSTIEFRPAD